MQRHDVLTERPLSARDYEVPIGWWGWSWEPPVPMSVTQILDAGNLDARTAALCGMTLAAHGSILIAAEEPHSGKTTTLTALLDFLPNRTRRVFVRGWSETFDYLRHHPANDTLLLANELSSHLPVYLWGPKAVRVFETLRQGYALASTLHADSAEDAAAQLVGELGVLPADLARIDLVLVMRILGTPRGAVARRVVSVHGVRPSDGSVALVPLAGWEQAGDAQSHDEPAELAVLAARGVIDADAELARLTAYLEDLRARRCWGIGEVRAALAAYRGEVVPENIPGDPVE